MFESQAGGGLVVFVQTPTTSPHEWKWSGVPVCGWSSFDLPYEVPPHPTFVARIYRSSVDVENKPLVAS